MLYMKILVTIKIAIKDCPCSMEKGAVIILHKITTTTTTIIVVAAKILAKILTEDHIIMLQIKFKSPIAAVKINNSPIIMIMIVSKEAIKCFYGEQKIIS